MTDRVAQFGLTDHQFRAYPVAFWDVFGRPAAMIEYVFDGTLTGSEFGALIAAMSAECSVRLG